MSQTLFHFLYGPTASGKTQFAFQWAKQHKGNLLSADSRQVFQHCNIVVGKDIAPGATWQIETPAGPPAWLSPEKFFLWGVDVVSPDQEFSLRHWYDWVQPILQWHREQHVPLMIVGGTWQWMQAILDPPATLFVPPNPNWRKKAQHLSISELQKELQTHSVTAWESLNQSDQSNPQRLVRAVEVVQANESKKPAPLVQKGEYKIFLRDAEISDLTANITARVLERIHSGAIAETKFLMENFPNWNIPAFQVPGYTVLRDLLENEITQDEAVEKWIHLERQYAKRQRTWIRSIQQNFETELV